MNTKKVTVPTIPTLVGVAAIITFLIAMSRYLPIVHAEEYRAHLTEFSAIKYDVTLILILQTEAEIVRLEEKIAEGRADRQDRLRLVEKKRQLENLNKRDNV